MFRFARGLGLGFLIWAASVVPGWAQAVPPSTAPGPSASPSASPLPPYIPPPTPAPPQHSRRITISGTTGLNIIDQNYVGSGLVPQEGPAFSAGLPFAPGTPYDFFSAAPTSPGFGLGENMKLDFVYGPSAVNYGVTLGFGTLSGSAQTIGYWGEQPIPTIDPHLGQTSFQLPIAYPTKPGQDDVSGVRGSVLGAFIRAKDGNTSLDVGWLDLEQTMPFVFRQAPVVESVPTLAILPPESIGSGAPSLDGWLAPTTQYPLSGVDLYVKRGQVALEGTDATLPAPMGLGARLTTLSAIWDRGDGLKYGAQVAHIATGGNPIATTTLYGAPIVPGGPCPVPAGLTPSALAAFPVDPYGQGPIPFTCLAGQQNTVWGVSAAGRLASFVDGLFEFGSSWYGDTYLGAVPASFPGAYVHGSVTEHLSAVSLTQEYYWVDPRYAPTILPYGAAQPTENIWSAAYTWPAQWLRGDYQSVDDTNAYNDRRGFRFGADYESDLIQARARYTVLSQIAPINLTTGAMSGFVEGYYLPELTATGGSLGIDRQLALWLALHPKFADFSFDYVTQNNYRPAGVSSLDTVAMRYPQTALTLSRKLADNLLLAGGYSNFTVAGVWAGGPVNMNQSVGYIGAQYAKSASQQFMLQIRGYRTHGIAPLTDTLAPTYNGLQIFFEQKAKL